MKSRALARVLRFKALAILFLIVSVGCATKEIEVIHTTLAPKYESSDDVLRVGTDKAIPVTVNEKYTEKEVPGWILVHPRDWEILLGNLN